MTNINGSLHNGSLDALPRTDETPGMPIKSFEKKTNKISTTNVNNNNNNNNNCINDTHCIAGVKLYGIWTKKLAKDQVTAEVAWKRLCKIGFDGLDALCERLAQLEGVGNEDEECLKLLDLDAMMEIQREILKVFTETEELETELKQVTKALQNIAQFLPPSIQRQSVKTRISQVRKRYFMVLETLSIKREKFRWMVSLLEKYKELGSDIKGWLDATEARSELFTSDFNNHALILENEEAIEGINKELHIKKDLYENFLDSGEGILDLKQNICLDDLQHDLDDVINRWDTLVSSIEKCMNRLKVAKEIAAESKRNDTEKIEQRIRSEAQLCTCHNPFRIVKVGDGKYTFGSSKIIRLVRIHGSSIVVRVGGGWEYLYDFLLKTDPCRAKQVADMSRNGVHTLHLAGLNLSPMDKKGSAAFTMNVRRMSQSTWSPHRNHHNRSGSLGSAASSDNIDSFYDESSESLSLSNSLSSPQKRLTNRITYTPKAKTIDRKYSYDSKLTHSADVARSKGLNRRVSLIERQSEYAEKKRLAKSFTIDQS